MKVVVVLLFIVAVGALDLTAERFGEMSLKEKTGLFESFLAKYDKNIAKSDYERTFKTFEANLERIDMLNSQSKHAIFGITAFADLSQEEFKHYYLGTPAVRDQSLPVAPEVSQEKLQDLPKSFDWRPKGAVTPVKNQGQCGSCWAFSATGNVEGQHFLATGKLVGLSEQNLVDCDHECMIYQGQKSCDAGCGGGLQPNAYHYIISNNGIDTESSYPYEAVDGTCKYNKNTVGATINNYTMVSKDEDQMAAYMVEHGPIAIAADATEWQFYIGGVFDAPCGTSLDHGILIVGYDEETDDFGFKIKYWIVKNSWGPDWGINGYMKIERGVGECGLNLFVSSAIINK